MRILTRIKIWENETIFRKVQPFSGSKNRFFSKKIFEKLNIFLKNYSKISKFQFYVAPQQIQRNSRGMLLSTLEISQKHEQNWLRFRRNYWNWDDISWKLWIKSNPICAGIQYNQEFTNNFHQALIIKKPAGKILLVWTKMKTINYEKVQANCEIL